MFEAGIAWEISHRRVMAHWWLKRKLRTLKRLRLRTPWYFEPEGVTFGRLLRGLYEETTPTDA